MLKTAPKKGQLLNWVHGLFSLHRVPDFSPFCAKAAGPQHTLLHATLATQEALFGPGSMFANENYSR